MTALAVALVGAACGHEEGIDGAAVGGGVYAAEATERYIVRFKYRGMASLANGKSAIKAKGGKIVKDMGLRFNAVAARMTPRAAGALAKSRGVDLVELDPRRYPQSFAPTDDKEYEDSPQAPHMPFGIQMVQADQVTADPAKRGDVMVCVIDSGFQPSHPDGTDDVSGYTSGPLPWNQDGDSHGTHVAGTIAAKLNGSGVRGVMPGAKLHIVRIFGDDGVWAWGSELADAVSLCIDAAAAAGTKLVVNMSLGGFDSSTVERDAMQAAYDENALLVAAAGNYGKGVAPFYPASYDSVISVASVDYSGTTSSFSQDNEFVELSAPGSSILSTVSYVSDVTVAGTSYIGRGLYKSPAGTATGELVDGGMCDKTSPSWSGKVVLCDPYGNPPQLSYYYEKVENVENSGGVAAIIWTPDDFPASLSLGDYVSVIPSISIVYADSVAALTQVGESATVRVKAAGSGYERWGGTSMATPHVAGVAALVWSFDARWPNTWVRQALIDGASDLGSSGRDDIYGHGLVQARGGLEAIAGCVKNGYCNATCSYDPDCGAAPPTGVARVTGSVSTGLGCGGSECNGYLIVVVTEHDQSPYHLLIGDFAGIVDLGSAPYTYGFDVPVTGKPMYLWAALYEGGSPASSLSTDDMVSSFVSLSPTAGATLTHDLSLDTRLP